MLMYLKALKSAMVQSDGTFSENRRIGSFYSSTDHKDRILFIQVDIRLDNAA